MLRAQVQAQGERLLPTAIQETLELVAVEGPEARGYLFHVTDRKPEKGPADFRELRQGAVVVGPLILGVTILTHSDDLRTVEAAVPMLAAQRYRARRP